MSLLEIPLRPETVDAPARLISYRPSPVEHATDVQDWLHSPKGSPDGRVHALRKHVPSVPQMREAVVNLLEASPEDFRSTPTLAAELQVPPFYVEAAIKSMPDLVRPPINAQDNESDLYRLVARGLTRGERLRKAKAFIGRYSID